MGKRLYHGAAYYPELWSEEIIEQDIMLMKEAGINVVRIGEFAWHTMEPEEGNIDLDFFVNVIKELYDNGIETVMCTPTPTPPIWFTHGHPERMYIDQDGKVMGHGSRQHACTNNAYFREKANIITEHIAKAVGNLPGLIGWQIDNEFKCHVSECMCKTCKSLWHEWLKERYGTVEKLNEAWGTKIWSEYYHSFEQVPQPGPAPFLHNSSLSTMYRLFSMEKIAEFSDSQAELIRKYSDAPITHNSNIPFAVDNERLFKNLDFASFDTYATQENKASYLMNCDLWRNFKRGRDFWIMETSTSYAASLESYASPHANGYLRAEAVAAYALGAEAFCYWLWRQQRAGCEQPHGSVISAWGKPTVGYQNVLAVEEMRKKIEPFIVTTRPKQPEVAVTYSDRAKVFLQTEPHQGLDYRGLITSFYERVVSLGIHRDVIPENASLEGYKLLFTPFVQYISKEYIDKAIAFVEAGGTWVVGPLSGGRTGEHTIHTNAALGDLEEKVGVEALYTYPMDGTGAIGNAFGEKAPLGLWSTIFEYDEKTAVGTVEGGVSEGKAFITEYKIGDGKVVMLGALPIGEAGDSLLKKMIKHYSNEADIPSQAVTNGTIVAPRVNEDFETWFVINMDGKGGTVTLPSNAVDGLSHERISKGEINVGPYEYRVIELR
ncbi:beta-galactosidase [Halalkalibacter urbisdiaboli]|uniref:beta-galactosidase n=1 Tax=Halalkalibacter urbisdiaboli TaxID=1960589 RepID=UPI000B4408C0|nr:beta-galactosidase [Halalkalibacter urbisdiaboli]